ncbi:MAG: glycosyltransferase family 4 protein [Nostocaceae cyanobacterium]|nr:glycosyltransferase family 4 protein [Nostocaceae cyanobacterium]
MNSLLIIAAIPDTIRAFLLPFAVYFRTRGWRVDAIAQGISTDIACLQAFDRVWDVDLYRSPLDPRNLLIAPSQIREIVVREKYDIVHVHMAVAAFITRYALKDTRKLGSPQVIYTAHGFNFYRGGEPLHNSIFLTLEKLAGGWTDYLVVMNQEDKEAAKSHHILPPQRVRYMPGIGVDISHYSLNRVSDADVLQVRQEMKLAADTRLFLSIAEFIPRKRHRDMLEAFAGVARDNVCLAFAGEGPLTEKMQQLASQLGIQDRVRFLGFRRDIPTLIQAAVATILVSEHEGLPRSIMESLCMGVPVIGTDIRGIRDLLLDGCGFLVKLGNTKQLTKAMEWILDHPEKAKVMGEYGRKMMTAYDLQNILQLHETLYTEALGKVNNPVSV